MTIVKLSSLCSVRFLGAVTILLCTGIFGIFDVSAEAENKQNAKKSDEKKVLNVAVYKSFTGQYGPGSLIKQNFERRCKCTLNWVSSNDAGSLYTDLQLGRLNTVDVILGFDNSMTEQMEASKKLEAYRTEHQLSQQALEIDSPFQPIDFGYFTVMVDSQKVTRYPETFASFLADSQFNKQFLAQDPRTSSPGFGLLVWLRTISKDQAAFQEKLLDLKKQTLTFSKSWSESYGFFTKGEAKAVFSYVTSQLYHEIVEKSTRYRALTFIEGNPLQIEYGAIIKNSKQKELSKDFLNYILEDEAQAAIAKNNWMFPASASALKSLPTQFNDVLKSVRTLKVSQSLSSPKSKEELLKNWKQTFQ